MEYTARAFFLRCRAAQKLPFKRPSVVPKFCHRRVASASSAPSKPYYVTSPIFYVNAAPHAGHLYTLVLTDVLKRWHQLRGDHKAVLLTGTDEHGMKIQKAAEKAQIPTQMFCDHHAGEFENLCKVANIEYDRFIRTTDEDHKAAVDHFWRELNQRGFIYESKHEGWYSVSDETFYPESQVHLVVEPSSGRKMHASIETGKEVEWTSETNYHFKLSEFKDDLLDHYKNNPDFIVPSQRMNFIIKEVESGLSDLSISRPSSRLNWGIRVPNDDSQTIYVWLDALINYLTMTGYPFASREHEAALWPPNCQVIGKDIIRFHTIYWPAFLMALGLPLPKQFLSHAHWTMNRAKMSKSLGNVVNPFFAIDRFGVDVIRFYMAHDGGLVDDAGYDNSYIIDKYKKALQGGLGNLLSRLVRGKKWSVRESVESAKLEHIESESLRPGAAEQLRHIKSTPLVAAQKMDELNPRIALHQIMELVYQTNKYFHNSAIWDTVNVDSDTARAEVRQVIFLCTEAVRIVSILLQPFMPTKSATALDWLGVSGDKRTFDDAVFGADRTYGTPIVEISKRGPAGTLFPPLSSEY